MLEGRVSRRELEAEKEGCASLNNESIDPPADDGSGCYDDRCSVTQTVEKRIVFQNRALEAVSGYWLFTCMVTQDVTNKGGENRKY